MMRPTQQGQVRQVGGPPSSQWARWWPSHQARGRAQSGTTQPPSRTARAPALGGGDDPAGAPDVQGLAGGAAQDRGQQGHGRLEPVGHDQAAAVAVGAVVAVGVVAVRLVAVVTARVTVVVVVAVGLVVVVAEVASRAAGDLHPGHRAVAGQPPTRLRAERPHAAELAAQPAGLRRLSRSTVTSSWGRTPPVGQLAALQGPAGQLGQGVGAALVPAARIIGAVRAGQRLQGRQQDLAGLGLQQSLQGDHAL
jgi:hypothetical protein